jgi:hypothetical protein
LGAAFAAFRARLRRVARFLFGLRAAFFLRFVFLAIFRLLFLAPVPLRALRLTPDSRAFHNAADDPTGRLELVNGLKAPTALSNPPRKAGKTALAGARRLDLRRRRAGFLAFVLAFAARFGFRRLTTFALGLRTAFRLAFAFGLALRLATFRTAFRTGFRTDLRTGLRTSFFFGLARVTFAGL